MASNVACYGVIRDGPVLLRVFGDSKKCSVPWSDPGREVIQFFYAYWVTASNVACY